MSAHLLILYPIPKDTKAFDRAYREEHLPYAGPRLEGATGVRNPARGRAWLRAAALSPDVRRELPDPERPEGLRHLQSRPGSSGARRLDQHRRRSDDHRHG